jgi:Spy/CpxP family protein refolding chaperone
MVRREALAPEEMKMKSIPTITALLVMSLVSANLPGQATPYRGQESRDIKALSADDVADLLAGKGMGLAKAAELNGYPGPLHVLENAKALNLSDRQTSRTQALFAAMQAKAKQIGKSLVDEERKLDRMFADRTVSREALTASLARIGALQADLRAAHLEAHLAQRQILTAEQNAAYVKLRGYDTTPSDGGGHSGHKH